MSSWGGVCGEPEKSMPGRGTEATKQSGWAGDWWGEQAPRGGQKRFGPRAQSWSVAETREEAPAEKSFWGETPPPAHGCPSRFTPRHATGAGKTGRGTGVNGRTPQQPLTGRSHTWPELFRQTPDPQGGPRPSHHISRGSPKVPQSDAPPISPHPSGGNLPTHGTHTEPISQLLLDKLRPQDQPQSWENGNSDTLSSCSSPSSEDRRPHFPLMKPQEFGEGRNHLSSPKGQAPGASEQLHLPPWLG